MKRILFLFLVLISTVASAQTYRVPSIPATSSTPTVYRHVQTIAGKDILASTIGNVEIDYSDLSGSAPFWALTGNSTLTGNTSILSGGFSLTLNGSTLSTNSSGDTQISSGGLLNIGGTPSGSGGTVTVQSGQYLDLVSGTAGGNSKIQMGAGEYISLFSDFPNLEGIQVTSSGLNYLQTGVNAEHTVQGANAGYSWLSNGTGPYSFRGNSTQAARITLGEDDSNGAHTLTLKPAESMAADVSIEFPAVTGTTGQRMEYGSDGVLVNYTPLNNPATTDLDQIVFDGTAFERKGVSGASAGDVWTYDGADIGWAAPSGGGGAVDDVTGTAPISVSPTTGSVVVSIANAAADGATKGAAAFNATYFDATTGVVTIDATNGLASSSQAGYIPTVSSTAGTFLRSTATASGWSTLVLPNAITANHVLYGTSSNNVGTSANFQFTGTTLNITGGIVGSTGVVNSTAAGSNNGVTSIRSGTLTANNVNAGFLSNGNYTLRSTGADINYINRINNGVTTGNSSQVIHVDRIDPSIVVSHATTTLNGIVYDPALSGANLGSLTHTGLYIGSGSVTFRSLDGTGSRLLQTGATGLVTPVASLGATDNAIPRTDGTGAGTLQGSNVTMDDDGNTLQTATTTKVYSRVITNSTTAFAAVSPVILSSGEIADGDAVTISVDWTAKSSSDNTGCGGTYVATWTKESGTLNFVGENVTIANNDSGDVITITSVDAGGGIQFSFQRTGSKSYRVSAVARVVQYSN